MALPCYASCAKVYQYTLSGVLVMPLFSCLIHSCDEIYFVGCMEYACTDLSGRCLFDICDCVRESKCWPEGHDSAGGSCNHVGP